MSHDYSIALQVKMNTGNETEAQPNSEFAENNNYVLELLPEDFNEVFNAVPITLSTESVPQINENKNTTRKSTGLLEFLQNDGEGKLILKCFEVNKNRMIRTNRSRLTRLVIKRERDHQLRKIPTGEQLEKFSISKSRFQDLAADIEKIFPGEVADSYFTAGVRENGICTNNFGTLWFHYEYTKKKLKTFGLLAGNAQVDGNDDEATLQQDDNECLNWLKSNIDPWNDVISYWTATFRERRELLLQSTSTVQTYLDTFPCIATIEGKQLLAIDFSHLYEDKSDLLFKRWNVLKTVIIEQLSLSKIKNSDDKALLKALPALNDQQQNAVILYLLPHLIEGHKRAPKRKAAPNVDQNPQTGLQKTTLQERRNTFILHVQNVADLEVTVETLKRRCRETNQTLQPFVAVTGDLTNVQQSFVIINDIQYDLPSCLDALDLAFKAFFALNCEYAANSSSLWQFIQQAGYDIYTKADRKTQSLICLIGLVKKRLESPPGA